MVAFFLVCSIFINLSKPCIACDLNLINYLFFCSKLTLTALFAQFLINSVHCTGNKIAKVSRDDVVNSFQYGIHSSIAFIALHSLQHCIHSTIAFIALHSFLCINVGCTPLTKSIQFRCSIERKWRQKWGCGGNFLSTNQPPSDHVISHHFIPLHQPMVASNNHHQILSSRIISNCAIHLTFSWMHFQFQSDCIHRQKQNSWNAALWAVFWPSGAVMFWEPQCTAAPYDPCLDQGYWLQWE